MLRKIYLVFAFAFTSSFVFAQTGTLKGVIKDAMTGEPIPFANVVAEKNGNQLGGKLLLLDLNDANMEDTYHSDRMREYNSPADYAKTYKNLSHLFFDKQSLSQRLETLGMWKIEFFPHAASDYGNSKFRFNLICTKA